MDIKCDFCDELAVYIDVPDPFMTEIHPDEEAEDCNWCKDCYHERVMDI